MAPWRLMAKSTALRTLTSLKGVSLVRLKRMTLIESFCLLTKLSFLLLFNRLCYVGRRRVSGVSIVVRFLGRHRCPSSRGVGDNQPLDTIQIR